MNTRILTLAALMAALSVCTVFLGVILPVMDLSFTAIAGLFPAAAVHRGGLRAGVMTWLTASILCLILAAAQPAGVLYACLFGLYPIAKTLCERGKRPLFVWAGKLLFAHLGGGAAAVVYALFFPGFLEREYLSEISFLERFAPFWRILVLLVLFWAIFVLYDVALSRVLRLIQKRFPFHRTGE